MGGFAAASRDVGTRRVKFAAGGQHVSCVFHLLTRWMCACPTGASTQPCGASSSRPSTPGASRCLGTPQTSAAPAGAPRYYGKRRRGRACALSPWQTPLRRPRGGGMAIAPPLKNEPKRAPPTLPPPSSLSSFSSSQVRQWLESQTASCGRAVSGFVILDDSHERSFEVEGLGGHFVRTSMAGEGGDLSRAGLDLAAADRAIEVLRWCSGMYSEGPDASTAHTSGGAAPN